MKHKSKEFIINTPSITFWRVVSPRLVRCHLGASVKIVELNQGVCTGKEISYFVKIYPSEASPSWGDGHGGIDKVASSWTLRGWSPPWTRTTVTVRTPTQCHIDLACNTSYHFAASRTVFPRVSPYLCPGPFAPFGTRI